MSFVPNVFIFIDVSSFILLTYFYFACSIFLLCLLELLNMPSSTNIILLQPLQQLPNPWLPTGSCPHSAHKSHCGGGGASSGLHPPVVVHHLAMVVHRCHCQWPVANQRPVLLHLLLQRFRVRQCLLTEVVHQALILVPRGQYILLVLLFILHLVPLLQPTVLLLGLCLLMVLLLIGYLPV